MDLVKVLYAGLAFFLPLVSSFAVDLEKRASDIDVTLSSAGGSTVKATVKNNAAETFKFLKSGTFLDPAPVSKATVFKDGAAVAFKGVLVRIKTSDISMKRVSFHRKQSRITVLETNPALVRFMIGLNHRALITVHGGTEAAGS